MMAKRYFTYIIVCLSLILITIVHAQTEDTPPRLENPTILPQNRVLFTADNATNIDLLAMWGLGNLGDVDWIDNTHLAVAASSGIWIYDLAAPDAPIAVLPSLDRWQSGRGIPLLTVSPDGKWLGVTPDVTRHFNRYNVGLNVWHIPTGNQIDLGVLIEGHTTLPQTATHVVDESHPVFVQWLADHRYLTAFGENILLWALSSDTIAVDMVLNYPRTERTSYHIEQVAVSHDMRWIAGVMRADISDQIIVQLWDTSSGQSRVLFEDDFLPEVRLTTRSIQFNADDSEVGLALISSDTSGSYSPKMELWRWSVENREMLSAYPIGCEAIKINFAHDNMICQSFNPSGVHSFQIVNLRDGYPLSEPVHLQSFSAIFDTTNNLITASNPRMQHLADRVSPYSAIIWSHNGEQVAALDLGDDQIKRVVISPDETRAALLQSNQVQIWDIESESHQLTVGHSGLVNIRNLAASPDGRYLIVIGDYPDPMFNSSRYPTRTLRWDLQTGSYEVIPDQDMVSAAAYSPDGRQLVLGGSDGMIRLYDAVSLTLLNVFRNEGAIRQVIFSHNGRLLAVANELYIRLWNTQNLTVINRVQAQSSRLSASLRFTADDGWLIFSGQLWKVEDRGHLMARWNAEDANEEVRLLLYGGTSCSYRAADGLLLHGLNLIDVNQGTQLWSAALFRYQQFEPRAVALTEDLIIAGFSDGSLRLYGIVSNGE